MSVYRVSLCQAIYEDCQIFLNTSVWGWAGLERFLYTAWPYNLKTQTINMTMSIYSRQDHVCISHITNESAERKSYNFMMINIAEKVPCDLIDCISRLITYGAKLLNADWLRQRTFFLITRALLVIKRAWLLDADWLSTPALSWFPASNGFLKISETHRFWVCSERVLFIITWKKVDM